MVYIIVCYKEYYIIIFKKSNEVNCANGHHDFFRICVWINPQRSATRGGFSIVLTRGQRYLAVKGFTHVYALVPNPSQSYGFGVWMEGSIYSTRR